MLAHGTSRCALLLVLTLSASASAQGTEALWYLTGSESSTRDFIAHARAISVASPQVFMMDSTGAITGSVDPRVVSAARQHHVKLVPLVMNPGFDQPSIHRVLTNADARARALVKKYNLRGYSVWVLGMEDPALWR